MNRIRRPWGPSRRDTDGVQMNTLNHNGATGDVPHGEPKKSGFQEPNDTPDYELGHLQEIEVDMETVVQDREVKNIEDDTSPYPEVRAVVPETDDTGPLHLR